MLSPRRSGLTVAPAQSDGDAYLRAQQDPEFLQQVRAAYTGVYDVMDALWWFSHPTETTPSGTPSPSAHLNDLQRRLFSATGDSLGNDRMSRELHQLEAEIAASKLSIRHAVATALARPARLSGSAPTQKDVAQDDAGAVAQLPAVPGTAERPAHRSRRTTHLITAFGMAAALACGVIIANSVNAAKSTDAAPAALLIFRNPQVPEDIPTQRMPPTFESGSFRELVPARFSWTDRAIYAVRAFTDMVCLVAVTSDQGHVSTCTHEDQFADAGLYISWSVDGEELDPGLPVSRRQTRQAVWRPDGEVLSVGPRE